MSESKTYLEPVNGIAEAIDYPEPGETVTLRGGYGEAVVERVDRRRNRPVILEAPQPFRAVKKRTVVEYSRRVGENE